MKKYQYHVQYLNSFEAKLIGPIQNLKEEDEYYVLESNDYKSCFDKETILESDHLIGREIQNKG